MYDLIVIGGGPAGLAAACAAWEGGLRRVLIVERDRELGGILNQCIHNGFGLHYFKEELTGPEYAGRFVDMLRDTGVEVRLDTMVLEVGADRRVHMVGKATGYRVEQAKSVLLAMGCRERTRGGHLHPRLPPRRRPHRRGGPAICEHGGVAARRAGGDPGSGDIGLIMARRMTLEGARVLACVEVMPYSGGLNRNIVQCLHDYDIPLYLSHTVTDIRGKDRVEQVVVSKVDERRRPIPGTEMTFDCDTLLLSVGLIPENELTRRAGIAIDPRTSGAVVYENMETSLAGVFACGNVAHVHDLVDFVTAESQRAGRAAARYVLEGEGAEEPALEVAAGDGVSYTVPQHIRPRRVEKGCDLFFRVNRVCGASRIAVASGGRQLAAYRRDCLAPGEMEHILIPRKLLDQAEGSITISIEEAEAG